jgi:hypothetical protein
VRFLVLFLPEEQWSCPQRNHPPVPLFNASSPAAAAPATPTPSATAVTPAPHESQPLDETPEKVDSDPQVAANANPAAKSDKAKGLKGSTGKGGKLVKGGGKEKAGKGKSDKSNKVGGKEKVGKGKDKSNKKPLTAKATFNKLKGRLQTMMNSYSAAIDKGRTAR